MAESGPGDVAPKQTAETSSKATQIHDQRKKTREFEVVSIYGSRQLFPKTSFSIYDRLKTILKDKTASDKLTFVEVMSDGTRQSASLSDLYKTAQTMMHRGEDLKSGDVVVVALPSGIDSLAAQLSVIIQCFVLVSLPSNDIKEIERVMNLVRPRGIIALRQTLVELDYCLQELKCLGMAFGGEGPLRSGSFDLSAKSGTITAGTSHLQTPWPQDVFCLFYDEKTRLVWECSHRSASALAETCIMRDKPTWRERTLSSSTSLSLLSEIIPRICSLNQETSMTIVMDANQLKSRIRRRQVVGPSSGAVQSQQKKGRSDLAELLLHASQSKIGSCDDLFWFGVRTDLKEFEVSRNAKAKGSLCISGPSLFTRIVGPLALTTTRYFSDSRFRLWLDLELPASIGEDEYVHVDSSTSEGLDRRQVRRPGDGLLTSSKTIPDEEVLPGNRSML